MPMRKRKPQTYGVFYRLTPLTLSYLKTAHALRRALGERMTYDEMFASAIRHSMKRLETRARVAGIDIDAIRAGVDKVKANRSRLDTLSEGPVIDEYRA